MPCDVVRVQVLMLCIFAGALDSLGDEGNRFARSTIMPQSFPVTKNPSTMSLISSSNVLATGFCMFLVMGTSKKLGLAIYTVFGNASSMVVQYSLMLIVQWGDGGWQLLLARGRLALSRRPRASLPHRASIRSSHYQVEQDCRADGMALSQPHPVV